MEGKNYVEDKLYQQYRELKIAPPTPDRVERLIRSATYSYEDQFFTSIYQRLSSQTCEGLDRSFLLQQLHRKYYFIIFNLWSINLKNLVLTVYGSIELALNI